MQLDRLESIMANRLTILLVDDEKHILDFYGTVLAKNNFDCICMESGEAAMDIMRTESIDVIVTDYKMPGMNGVELLEEIMETNPAMRRIMITGSYGTSDQMMSVLDNELAHKVLSKPCGMDVFLAAVSEQVEYIDPATLS
jgi:DNA-binding NtrC family response regulator